MSLIGIYCGAFLAFSVLLASANWLKTKDGKLKDFNKNPSAKNAVLAARKKK